MKQVKKDHGFDLAAKDIVWFALVVLFLVVLGLLQGCATDGDKTRAAAWQAVETAKANAAKEAAVAQAENPSEVTLEPSIPGQPVTFNGKLTVKLAQGGGQQLRFDPTPMPKSDFAEGVDAVKSVPGEVGRTILGVKALDTAEVVLGKAFDKAGGKTINKDVGNVTGDMNSTLRAGDHSPAQGGGVTGPRDPVSIISGE